MVFRGAQGSNTKYNANRVACPMCLWFSCGHLISLLLYLHEPDRSVIETISHQDAHGSGKHAKKPRSLKRLTVIDKEVNGLKRVLSAMMVVTVH